MRKSDKIVVIGDVMLDVFCLGKVVRLNPESPAPLINLESEESRLGWAANVAANVVSLWKKAVLVGRVGEDRNAAAFRELCSKAGVELREIVVSDYQTVTKTRIIEMTYRHQLLRMDSEKVVPFPEDRIGEILTTIRDANPSLIVVSDYKKGLVTKALIRALIDTGIPVIADAKPGNMALFSWALLIKPNYKEFFTELGVTENNSDEAIGKYGPGLAASLGTNLLVTRSEKGASLIRKDGRILHMPTEAKDVFDVTWAGDSFIAGVAVSLADESDLEDAVRFGNRASGVAVGKVGTAAVRKDEML